MQRTKPLTWLSSRQSNLRFGSSQKPGVATVGESTPAQAVMSHLLAKAITCFVA